jgi:hypothetical protein
METSELAQTEDGETLWRLYAKNSSGQAEQSIPHATVTFYGDCVKMCEDFAPNFGDKGTAAVASRKRTVSHFLYPLANFDQNNMTVAPHPQPAHSPDLVPCDYFLFSRLKICRCGSTEAMVAE